MKFGLVMLLLAYTIVSCASPAELQIDRNEGQTPFQVTVIGPIELTENKNNTFAFWTGCGVFIDWGDYDPNVDTHELEQLAQGDSCQSMFSHTYDEPGTYTIVAETWYPGPNDAPITESSWTTTVTVR